MKIFLAADHRGFALKEQLKSYLSQQSSYPATQPSSEIIDVGAFSYDPDDNDVDFGSTAVKQMQAEDRAILLCGSGHGMDMTANRFSHIRGILGFNKEVVQMGREHEDANVLILPAEWITPEESIERINIFLSTPFSGKERYIHRLEKLASLTTKP